MYNTTERLRNSASHDFYKHVDTGLVLQKLLNVLEQ